MSKTDWTAIQADYLATGLPYSELAKKWGVSISTLKKRAMREKWGEKAARVALEAAREEEQNAAPAEPLRTDEEPGSGKEPEPDAVPSKKEPKKKKEPVVPEEEPETSWALDTVIVDPEGLAVEMRRARRNKLLKTTDAMMDRIIMALDAIDPTNTYAISMLVRALKDLRDLQGLNKDQLDLEEQQARIAKLRSETRDQESESAGGVLLIPAIDEELQPPEEEK